VGTVYYFLLWVFFLIARNLRELEEAGISKAARDLFAFVSSKLSYPVGVYSQVRMFFPVPRGLSAMRQLMVTITVVLWPEAV